MVDISRKKMDVENRKISVVYYKSSLLYVSVFNRYFWNIFQVLKLYAWEPFFRDKILAIREEELKNIKYGAMLGACTYIIWFCAPFLVSGKIHLHAKSSARKTFFRQHSLYMTLLVWLEK